MLNVASSSGKLAMGNLESETRAANVRLAVRLVYIPVAHTVKSFIEADITEEQMTCSSDVRYFT